MAAGALALLAFVQVIPAARSADVLPLLAAVDLMAGKVVKAGKLKGEVVTVSANDIYDADSGENLPLSERLRELVSEALRMQGVKTRKAASLDDDQWSFHIQWKKDQGKIHMTAIARLRARNGSERAIARRARVDPASIDAALLRTDPRSKARTVVRTIEKTSQYRYTRSIHLRPVAARKDDGEQKASRYFGKLLKTALRESSLLHFAEQSALYGVPVTKLRTRGIRRVKKKDKPTKASLGLTSDLLSTDSELIGNVDLGASHARLSVNLNDRTGKQIASAEASMPVEMLPADVVAAMKDGRKRPATVARPPDGSDLVVELSTTRGEGAATFRDGEKIRFLVRVNRESYIHLFDFDSEDNAILLFPDPDGEAIRLKKDVPVILPDDNVDYELEVQEPFGRDTILVVATDKPLLLPNWAKAESVPAQKLRDLLNEKARSMTGGYGAAEIEIVTREN